MLRKSDISTLSIYVPKSKATMRPIERLMRVGAKKDRSVNYLVVEAIMQYLDREEKKN